MKAADYSERNLEVDGWKLRLTSYRIGDVYHCVADNVSPGSNIARGTGSSREEAEQHTLDRARKLLSTTKRRTV